MIDIGEFLIWRSIPISLNRQIKNLAKVSRYTVYGTCTVKELTPIGRRGSSYHSHCA